MEKEIQMGERSSARMRRGSRKQRCAACLTAEILGYLHLPCPQRSIAPLHQLLAELIEESFQTFGFNHFKRHSVNTRRAVVALRQSVGFPQGLSFANVIVQPQKRQDSSAFAWTYSLRLRSCRLLDAFSMGLRNRKA